MEKGDTMARRARLVLRRAYRVGLLVLAAIGLAVCFTFYVASNIIQLLLVLRVPVRRREVSHEESMRVAPPIRGSAAGS